MDIEQLKIVCDMVSKLGSDAVQALVWYCLLNLIPSLLLFVAGMTAIITIPRLIYKAYCPTPQPESTEDRGRRAEIHRATMQAISENRITLQQPRLTVKEIVNRWNMHFRHCDSETATKLTQADIDTGRI